MNGGTVESINVSDGGVPKRPVTRARVTMLGVEGDRQDDLVHHGGPDRAVCLFSADVIASLRSEGHPIEAGTTGDNLTISGLDWSAITPGTRLRVGGSVELEITSYTTPCKTIAGSFTDGGFVRILQDRHPGESRVYARVLGEGEVAPGDAVEVVA
ncbi:MAG: MOSC domain-containing protein [Phycisphaeraceae bacterium]|nr:MAG: MOSC domain-containing protein [Phycisphaeraceae bacterium]